MTTGERIKARRKEIGMTADRLAEKIGVSRSTIFRYENGDIEKMPVNALVPIAQALSTSVEYLMGWEEEQKKNDIQADIILKMRTDTTFMSVVEKLYSLDQDKLESINQMLNTLFK